ncbi:MAG: aminotransferase class I/II-fold pyridoxal phosphate-dependent enzyme [Planctomycetota bacterium]|jgi:8-amino-7-oxononanoate synthase
MTGIWDDWLSERRSDLEATGLHRRLLSLTPDDGLRGEVDGKPVVVFASNDYLGLSFHPSVREAVADAARRHGMGPRGASLVCGHTSEHEALARELAELVSTEVALLCPTGYAANLSVLSALAGPETAILSDARNHASIIDGCRLATERGAEVLVFDHADPEHLERLLRETKRPRRLIVTDTVFSMDGDVCPLAELVELKLRYDALLMIDEAHAVLVFGDGGGGLAEEVGLLDDVDIHVGTLGKALGAQGGFVAGGEALCDHVLNRGRPQIYSTALPLPVVVAARAALDVFRSDPGLRERLFRNVELLGSSIGARSPSPIFAVVLEEEARARHAARELLRRGYHVPAIRPPTVPPGTSRLRITVSAGHTDEEIRGLGEELGDIRASLG